MDETLEQTQKSGLEAKVATTFFPYFQFLYLFVFFITKYQVSCLQDMNQRQKKSKLKRKVKSFCAFRAVGESWGTFEVRFCENLVCG